MKNVAPTLTKELVKGKSHTRYILTDPDTGQPTPPLRLQQMYKLCRQKGWTLTFNSEKPS